MQEVNSLLGKKSQKVRNLTNKKKHAIFSNPKRTKQLKMLSNFFTFQTKKKHFFSFPFFIRALPKFYQQKKNKRKEKKQIHSKALTRNIPAMRIRKKTTTKHTHTTRTTTKIEEENKQIRLAKQKLQEPVTSHSINRDSNINQKKQKKVKQT